MAVGGKSCGWMEYILERNSGDSENVGVFSGVSRRHLNNPGDFRLSRRRGNPEAYIYRIYFEMLLFPLNNYCLEF